MNKHVVVVFFLALAGAAIYYCYEQGFFEKPVEEIEVVLEEICDPSQEDCSEFQEVIEA